jgi:hypothetical protein
MGGKLRFISELAVERNPLNQTSLLCLFIFELLGFYWESLAFYNVCEIGSTCQRAYLPDWRVVMRRVEIAPV